MRLHATAEGATRLIEIDAGDGKGPLRAIIDGREYLVDATSLSPGVYSLVVGGKVFTAAVSLKRGKWEVQVGSWSSSIEIEHPRRSRPASKAAAVAGGRQEITAPMSGRVVHVLVQPNDSVQEGASLVIIEAMKMETEIRSPIAGHVRDVRVQADMAVETGQVLVVVEG